MKNATNKKIIKSNFLDKIQCGDSASVLKQIPDNSIDLVITSPPYFQQRKYGGGETGNEKSIESYIDAIMDVFHECVRVISDHGSIVFNMGDKYIGGSLSLLPYQFAICALNMEKIKLVNNITWVKTNPTPRQFKRRLVSSTEPFFHFVKSNDYYYNIDSFQKIEKPIKVQNPNPRKSTIGNKYMSLIKGSSLTSTQKILASRKLNEVIEEVKRGKITGFRMKIKGIHSPAFGGQNGGRHIQIEKNGFTIIKLHGNTMKKDVISSSVESIKWNNHPAIYPEHITSEMIKLLTPPDNSVIVLDPYMGSGTTGVSAKKLNRHFIGIDINPEFCEKATKRIQNIVV